jgi:hypothetical protein
VAAQFDDIAKVYRSQINQQSRNPHGGASLRMNNRAFHYMLNGGTRASRELSGWLWVCNRHREASRQKEPR